MLSQSQLPALLLVLIVAACDPRPAFGQPLTRHLHHRALTGKEQQQPPQPECARSGLCSKGKLQPWTGDIHPSERLREALAARSFQQELILMSHRGDSLLALLQMVRNWAELGMEHILVLCEDQACCGRLAPHVAHLGCAWDSWRLPVRGEDAGDMVAGPLLIQLWNARWRTLARAARLGYNVLVTDTDVVVFKDPYQFWKAPPFNNFTILGQAEVLYDEGMYQYVVNPNGGIVYVQNARPGGVAAWLLAEVTDRLMRWVDDDFNLTRSKGIATSCNYPDQDAFLDGLSSTCSGRLHFINAVAFCWKRAPSAQHRDKVYAAVFQQMVPRITNEEFQLPEFMHSVARGSKALLRYIDMQMPNNEGQWPEEFGGQWLPERRGPLSSRWQALLRQDAPDMWPDPEDPGQAARARAVPRERYLYMPPWLALGFFPRGSSALWIPSSQGEIHQVIGHAHYLPGTHGTISKALVKQLVDRADWDLAHQLARPNQEVFFANTWTGRGARPGLTRQQVEETAPRLLLVHPRVHLENLRSYAGLFAVLEGMMQLAALSNRTLVWPDLPCALPWIGKVDAALEQFTPRRRGLWYPHGHNRTAEGLLCTLTRVLVPECLYDLRGLVGVEFEHYVQRHRRRYLLVPGAGNVAFFPQPGRQEELLDSLHLDPSRVIVEVPADDARQHLAGMDGAQAVFVEHPVRVAGYDIRKGVFGHCLSPDNQASARADGGDPTNAAQAVRAWPGRVGPRSGLRVDDAEQLVKELHSDLALGTGGQLGGGRGRSPRRGRAKTGQGQGAGGLTRQSRRFAKSQAKRGRAGPDAAAAAAA